MRKSAALLLFVTLPVIAGVYRWTDDKGVVHYSDAPPTPNAQPTALPQLQTFDAKSLAKGTPVGSSGDSAANSPAPTAVSDAAPAATARLAITSPQDQATIRDDSGGITVSVTTIEESALLVYYLDGKAQNDQPTPSTSFLIENVDRGTHTLEVATVDANGQQTSRSAKVTIYYMPARTNMNKATKKPGG